MFLTSRHAVSEHLPWHRLPSPMAAHLLLNCPDDQGEKSLLLCIDWPEFYLWPTFNKTCLSSQFPITAFPVNEGGRIPTSPLVLHTWVCNGPLRVQPWGLTAETAVQEASTPLACFFPLEEQGRVIGWFRTKLLLGYVCHCLVAKSCPTLATPWTIARQPPGKNTGVHCHLGKGILELHPGISLSFASFPLYLWKVRDFIRAIQNGAHVLYQLQGRCSKFLYHVTGQMRKDPLIHITFEGGDRELAQGSTWIQKLLDSSPTTPS